MLSSRCLELFEGGSGVWLGGSSVASNHAIKGAADSRSVTRRMSVLTASFICAVVGLHVCKSGAAESIDQRAGKEGADLMRVSQQS